MKNVSIAFIPQMHWYWSLRLSARSFQINGRKLKLFATWKTKQKGLAFHGSDKQMRIYALCKHVRISLAQHPDDPLCVALWYHGITTHMGELLTSKKDITTMNLGFTSKACILPVGTHSHVWCRRIQTFNWLQEMHTKSTACWSMTHQCRSFRGRPVCLAKLLLKQIGWKQSSQSAMATSYTSTSSPH